MSDITSLIERLVSAGCDPVVAGAVVAEAIMAGKDAAPYRDDLPDARSKGAIRQHRYRNRRNKNVTRDVTERNALRVTENVTERNESVTERNENVTPLRSANNDISLSSTTSKDNQEKEERKKERKPRKRNAPLPHDWSPSMHSRQLAELHDQNVQLVEQIFRDYLKSSGKLYADYDAAFNNFIRNQHRFNGGAKNGTASLRPGQSLTESIRRELAELERSESSDLEMPASPILRISN